MGSFLSLLPSLVRALVTLTGDALSPASCAACDAPVSGPAVFCPTCVQSVVRASVCAAALEPDNQGPRAAIAFGVFGGPVAVALRRFKYESRPDLARPLGHLLRRAARESGLRADAVVPVPLHPRRLAERGYNQAALLAAEVATELGAPLFPCALARTRNTSQQARLDRRGRLENIGGAFRAVCPPDVRGRRVVVVDDVVTTGATLAGCAEALLGAGALAVSSLVVARSEV